MWWSSKLVMDNGAHYVFLIINLILQEIKKLKKEISQGKIVFSCLSGTEAATKRYYKDLPSEKNKLGTKRAN